MSKTNDCISLCTTSMKLNRLLTDGVGITEGELVGRLVGLQEGAAVGLRVGGAEGLNVGVIVG